MISQTNPAMSAGLARRLAEAADGLRDDNYYYFVSQQNYPYDLQPVAGSTIEQASYAADSLASELNSIGNKEPYYKYGPYHMPLDYVSPIPYDTLEIKMLSNGSTVYSETFGNDTDAIILNLSAFDKFLLPYYTRLYGVDIARNMREAARLTFSSTTQSPNTATRIVTHKGTTLSTGTA
ncbi:MAG TPA: hypothetical protein PKM63_01080 [Panacibacter sp.]|nr:hypothetical protein [Panacibacter sp.]HNP42846.1 hypothetical protein [Panacibacter sp.]